MNIFLLVILWRFYLFVVAYITQISTAFTPTFPYSDVYLIPSGLPQWLWSWANFDGVHYLTLAKNGYRFAQFTQVFFPVYPLLVRFIAVSFGDKNFVLSGVGISFISFFLAVYSFRKLLRLDYDEQVVKLSLLFLFLFPTSFYFGALYSEAFFFFLVVCAFLCARKKRWWLSGVLGAIASSTRVTGVFLWPALLWEWHNEFRIKNLELRIKKGESGLNNYLFYTLKSPVFYLVPLGLFFYMMYLQIVFKDPLYFWHVQGVFGAERSSYQLLTPFHGLWRYTKILLTVSFRSYQFWSAVLELGSFLTGAALLGYAHKLKIRSSYLIFTWLSFITPTLTGTFSSLPRYLLSAFPIFIVLGRLSNKKLVRMLLLVCGGLLTWLTSLFLRGLWVA